MFSGLSIPAAAYPTRRRCGRVHPPLPCTACFANRRAALAIRSPTLGDKTFLYRFHGASAWSRVKFPLLQSPHGVSVRTRNALKLVVPYPPLAFGHKANDQFNAILNLLNVEELA